MRKARVEMPKQMPVAATAVLASGMRPVCQAVLRKGVKTAVRMSKVVEKTAGERGLHNSPTQPAASHM
jgi:hypothetical protein